MKKVSKLLALVLSLAMCAALAACGSNGGTTGSAAQSASSTAQSGAASKTDAPAGDTIKLGAIFNVTGDQSSIDAPAQKGFELAVKLINEQGGINGRTIEAHLL